ncbi:hypothetical protein, partial [Maritalea sp.]|uniref:hypothetical protein n=1 Tax=Maritalea sp. TaxID=2003361 RepID=UPI0039E49763
AVGRFALDPGTPEHLYAPPLVALLLTPAPPSIYTRRRWSLCSLPRHPRAFIRAAVSRFAPDPGTPANWCPTLMTG